MLIILAFTAFFLTRCSSKVDHKFRLPNGVEIKQGTISEMERVTEVRYAQYRGFVLEYRDSLFSEALLILPNNSSVVGVDVLNADQVNRLRSQPVEAINFTYPLSGGKRRRDAGFEAHIKELYQDYDVVLPLQDGFELKMAGYSYVKVMFHDLAIPNYSITVYPQR